MDHHHHHHHRHNHNPEFMDSRYFPLHPPPPPPPSRPFPDDHPSLFPPPPPPPPHRHLPPPPPYPPPPPPPPHSLSHRPPIPCILHHQPPPPPLPPPPPPPLSHHHHHHYHQQHQQRHLDDRNFVNSPPPHHRRHLPIDDDPVPFRPSSRVPVNHGVVYDYRRDEVDDHDRYRFRLPDPPRVPVDARHMSDIGGLDWDRHVHVPRPSVNLDRISPPPFMETDDRYNRRDIESPPTRFREDLNVEHRRRLRPDDIRDRRDDRRIDEHCHEQYDPEMLLRGFEPNSGIDDCVQGVVDDEVSFRGIRDDVVLNENLNVRRSSGQPPRREVSRSPIKFRSSRAINVDDEFQEFYEEGINRGSESVRYSDRGRREELQDYNRTPRKNLQKKSAFLRIQKNSSIRNNRYDTTPSPHKGKKSLELLDHRLSEERHGSPVELDVSFKSNALVAKAIMASPLAVDPTENSATSYFDNRIDSESPSKIESGKNSENKSFISRKEDKNRIRMSPIMKRVGSSNVEVRGSNSESSSSGSSSLCGDSTRRGSPKGEVSDKDDTDAGFGNVSSPNARRKRKSIIPLSRLSGSVPEKTDDKVVNRDSSANHLSKSSPSDKCIKQSVEELSSGDQVVGQSQNEVLDTGKLDVNVSSTGVVKELMGNSVSEASIPKRLKKRGRLEFLPELPEPRGPESSGNTKGCVQDVQKASDSDEDVAKAVERFISDISTELRSSKGQDIVLLSANNGSGEGSSEPNVGGNVDNIGNLCGNVDKQNFTDVSNSLLIPSINIQNAVDLTCTAVHVDKPCGSQVILPPERSMVGQSCGYVHLDNDVNQAELNSKDIARLGKFSSIDLYSDKTSTAFSYNDVVSVDSEKLTTASDIRDANDIQEQCHGAGTTFVSNVTRERSTKACVAIRGDLNLLSTEEKLSLLSRKRKADKLISLDSGISASFQNSAVTVSFPIEDSNLSVEKLGPAVSGLPCCVAESDVSHGNELAESPMDNFTSINHGRDSDPIEDPFSCSKKQKCHPLQSVISASSVSENCDFSVSTDTLIPMVEVPLNSVKHSTHNAEGSGLPKSVLPDKCVADAAINSLSRAYCLADSSNADLLCGGPCLPVKESTPPDEKQSHYLSESECKQKETMNLRMAEASDGSESIKLQSEGRMATNHQNGGVQVDLSGVSENADEEGENNTAANANFLSVSDCSRLCAKSVSDQVATYSDMLDPPSNVDSSGAGTAPAPSVMSEEKLVVDGKFSKGHLSKQGSMSSHSSSVLESNDMNLKPRISAAPGNQSLALKIVPVQSKNAKITISSSNAVSKQLIKRNVVTRADASSSSGRASSVTIHSKKAGSTFPTKPRTWHRTDNLPAAKTLMKKPSVVTALPQRPPIDKTVKVQRTSYIRKGNSLVRNPASGAATLVPRAFGASVNQSKTNDTNTIKKPGSPGMIDSTVVSDCLTTGGRHISIEMPKTPPLPCNDKASNPDTYSGDCRSSPPIGRSEGLDDEEALRSSETASDLSGTPEIGAHRQSEDLGTLSDGNLPTSKAKRIFYIKRKSNQLIAASNPSEPSMHNMDNAPVSSSDNSYYKRRKNQLIRASSESKIQQMVAVMDDSSNSHPHRDVNVHPGRRSAKRQSNKVKPSKVSLVWKLGDTKASAKGVDLLRCGKILSHLLPWKRATYWRSVWQSTANFSDSSSLVKTRKLLSSRKRATVYVRSGRGFSLRRSKVISLGGSSLKWSKSMERRSKKIKEETALAVAAMDSGRRRKTDASGVIFGAASGNRSSRERIFRIGMFRYRMDPSRRTLQRIPDDEPSVSAASKTEKDARKTYVPKRLIIGSNEYVRIGNGNQLVRDPKRRTRILASEKVRWSLHTARMRLAKKRKFCQFFTRFGTCRKGEGKCPFIHDPSKIAVCTKFLNGLCGDPNCKLTHKVIPERMPDCSYFLQGLCSNENCPYRHVNVNPKASICENFLRGYCAEGNECRKKHSYMCPEFEATGSCPRGSKCKLYHPKSDKVKKRKVSKDQSHARGRYFGSGLTIVAEPETAVAEKHVARTDDDLASQGGELGDYISLDATDDEAEEYNDTTDELATLFVRDGLSSQLDDLDELIKPLRLLDRD